MLNIIKIPTILLALFSSSCIITQNKTQEHNLSNQYWELVELDGKAIPTNESQPKDAHIILNEDDGTVIGNSGCNSIRGKYSTGSGNSIKFSSFASTKMACIGVDYEIEFLQLVEQSTSYQINSDTLLLKDSQQNILVKLKAGKAGLN